MSRKRAKEVSVLSTILDDSIRNGDAAKKLLRCCYNEVIEHDLYMVGGDGNERQSGHAQPKFLRLHEAVAGGHADRVRELLENRRHDAWSLLNGRKQTPMHIAAEQGQLEIAQLLMDAAVATDKISSIGPESHNSAVNRLVSSEDQVEARAVHAAAERGHVAVVQLLMSFGADPCARDERQRTPLHVAAAEGHSDVVLVLLGESLEVPTKAKKSGSLRLFRKKSSKMKKTNLNANAAVLKRPPPSTQKTTGSRHGIKKIGQYTARTERGLYAMLSYDEMVSLYTKKRPKRKKEEHLLDMVDDLGETALHKASAASHVETVRALIELGANASEITRFGATPLHLAARTGQVEIAKELVEKGMAEVDTPDAEGRTPLHYAAAAGRAQMITLLAVTYTANVSVKDLNDTTPLDLASSSMARSVFRSHFEELCASAYQRKKEENECPQKKEERGSSDSDLVIPNAYMISPRSSSIPSTTSTADSKPSRLENKAFTLSVPLVSTSLSSESDTNVNWTTAKSPRRSRDVTPLSGQQRGDSLVLLQRNSLSADHITTTSPTRNTDTLSASDGSASPSRRKSPRLFRRKKNKS